MNTTSGLHFLRPYLCQELSIAHKSAYIRFYNTTRALAFRAPPPRCRPDNTVVDGRHSEGTAKGHSPAAKTVEADRFQVEDRVKELQKYDALRYPRIKPRESQELHFTEIKRMLEESQPGDRQLPDVVELRGRVRRIRISGQKLFFLDIIGDGHQLQAAFDYTQIEESQRDHEVFRQVSQMLRRGDVISVAGNPKVFKNGQRGIFARSLPVLLSPSLASLPTKLEDPQTRIRNRHADLLVNKPVADRIRLRSIIMHYMRTFLLSRRFVEVQTPIIADKAGGAIARPFTTVATEFSDKQLALRVAPEIWLKRLVLGGLDRVFEIGPAFRNEGLDATHNPEFTTCEFYEAYADLEALMSMTERLIFGMSKHIDEICIKLHIELPGLLLPKFFKPRFERLEFLPTIEARLEDKLPDLSAEGAQGELVAFFLKHEIPLPASPTLPKLLDKLSALYIEPECEKPTFIMHHPACMAPLAKSFLDPTTNQELSARAELFIKNKEIANMYEEENSPFEQRRKFVEQAKHKDDENKAEIDESYLEALEWGLPPTGGWGCGIDRLCMLMTGAERINDVLTFGSLKNVVSLNSKPGQDVEPAMKSISEPEEN